MKLKTALRYDIHENFLAYFQKIDTFYIRVFIILLLLQNIVFLFYSTNFLFGNHDWNQFNPIGTFDFLAHGRWFLGIAANFNGGHIQPIIHMLAGSVCISISSILICNYLSIQKTYINYITYGLFISITPYIIGILYFVQSVFPFFFALLLSVISLEAAKHRSVSQYILSVICILVMLATYGNALTALVVIFIGKVTLDCVRWKGTWNEAKKVCLEEYIPTIICCITGGILFAISIVILRFFDKIPPGQEYATSIIAPGNFIPHFLTTASQAFKQLWLSQPFIPAILKYQLLCIVILSMFCMAYSSIVNIDKICIKTTKIILLIFCLLCMLLATKLPFYISDQFEWAQHHYRFSYYGIVFFYAFCAVSSLIYSKYIIKSICIVLSLLVLFNSAVQDFEAQKLWKIASQNGYYLFNRILERIESNPAFSFQKQYTYLNLGYFPLFGRYLIDKSKKYDVLSNEFIEGPSPQWGPAQGFQYLEPRLNIINQPYIHLDFPKEFDSYSSFFLKNRELLKSSKPWPHATSVHVVDDTILVILDQSYIDKALALSMAECSEQLFKKAKIVLGDAQGRFEKTGPVSFLAHPGATKPTVVTFDTTDLSSLTIKSSISLEAKNKCGNTGGDVNITFVAGDKSIASQHVVAGEDITSILDISNADSLTVIVDANGSPNCDWLTLDLVDAKMIPETK